MTIRLQDYIGASYPCMFLHTSEPDGAERMVYSALRDLDINMRIAIWSSTKGLLISDTIPEVGQDDSNVFRSESSGDGLADALEFVSKQEDPTVGIFYNIRSYLAPQIIQKILDCVSAVEESGSHIIFTGAHIELPIELQSIVTWVDVPLPSQDDLKNELTKLAAAYASDISLPEDKAEKEDLITLAARAASGLDYFAAKNAFSLTICKDRGISIETIQEQKQTEIRKSDVLDFIPWDNSMEDVGGFSELKEWLYRRDKVFSKEALEYGLPFPKGVLICGVPGCLSKDTLIPVHKQTACGSTCARFMTIEQLYYKFNGKVKEGKEKGVLLKYARPFNSSLPVTTRSFDAENNVVCKNKIVGVMYSGVKQLYEVCTEFGMKIKATEDHRFCCADKVYRRLHELHVGDDVICYDTTRKGRLIASNHTGRNANIALLQISNVGNHPNARIRVKNGLSYSSHPLHRLVVEAHMNSLPLEKFLYVLQGDVKDLLFLDSKMEVHHIDNNRLNNTVDNLIALSKSDHAKLHYEQGSKPHNCLISGRLQKIVSIKHVGSEDTYDITMEAPFNNFVADGFVVHNSGKSLVSQAIAAYLKLPLLRLDIGKVFRPHVGDSESSMRQALKTAESIAPVVLHIDEIEKALAGSKSSGELDSGVTGRVISTFLTWRQETKAPIFVAATANDISGLEGMVQRRFDAIWGVGLPSECVRRDIFSVHIRKRGRNPENFNLDMLAKKTKDFVGSEIEQVVADGMHYGFFANREFTTEDMLMSISETIPQATRNSDEVKALTDWMDGRARMVDLPEVAVKKRANVRSLKTK